MKDPQCQPTKEEDISYDPRGAQGYRSKDVSMSIEERLRNGHVEIGTHKSWIALAVESADQIKSLRAQLASARKALEEIGNLCDRCQLGDEFAMSVKDEVTSALKETS